MNALAPLPTKTPTASAPESSAQEPQPNAAEALAVLPLAQGAWLLVGRAAAAPPAAGIAQLDRRRSDRGQFRALAWSDADGSMRFVAALRLPMVAEIQPGQLLALDGQAGAATVMRLPAANSGAREFTAALALHARSDGARLARFLLDILPPAAMRRLPAVAAMLAGLLADIATQDGFVELMGAIPGMCGFLQGWGGPTGRGELVAVLVSGTQLTSCRVRVAGFDRPDIAAPASGVVLVLPAEAVGAVPILEQIYLLAETGVLCRKLAERRVLTPSETSGHIRDMLPVLHGSTEAIEWLRSGLRPRFEGRETLGEQNLPVRAAIDLALTLADDPRRQAGSPSKGAASGGAYLSGWLFDPANLVTEVHLRGAAGPGVRLDRQWTRVARPDVSDALARAGGFPAAAGHEHGFAVFVEASPAVAGPLYLDISFADGSCAFLPVSARAAEDPAMRLAALGATDLHKPSGVAIVEQHLGPLFGALLRRAPPPVPAPGGGAEHTWQLAVVVPLLGAPVLPRSVLSQFLHDGLAADEGLVFVCGTQWDDGARATLQRLAAFMGLSAIVVRADGACGSAGALDAAAAATQAPYLLLADPTTAGCAPGWRAALLAAAAGAKPAVACPTLVYEDFSIRYAGADALVTLPVAPYVTVPRRLAGMPAALVDAGPPQPVAMGTLTCCLVPRAVLSAIGGAGRMLASAFGQETQFFLRLQAAGIACRWVPAARVFAAEAAAGSASETVGRLADGWCLRAAAPGGGAALGATEG